MSRKFIVIAVGGLLILSLLAACGAPTAVPEITEAATEAATETPTEAPTAAVTEAPTPEPPQVTAYILPYTIDPDMGIEKPSDLSKLGFTVADTGNEVEGATTIITTGLNNIGIGGYSAVQAFALSNVEDDSFTYEWNLTVPDGSAATLVVDDTGLKALWMADVPGDYVLTLTATNKDGVVGESTWTVHATTYVGNGAVTGESAAAPQCAACHSDKIEEWKGTGHSSMLTRGIDGTLSSHYSGACISCHTTGFNNRPEAVNGGFDDLATEAGWTFPETLAEGNWDAFVAGFPQVAALANIQCESCHGPGADHSGSGPIGVSLSEATCAQCHAEGPHHVFPQEWELSGHAKADAMAFTYPIGEDHASCVRCHSGAGYIDFSEGKAAEEQRTDYQIITCAVCHDPHDATNPNQLRIYDTVTLPSGVEITDAGPAATCMSCHNTRVDAVAAVEGERFGTPHYSAATELLHGTGGYTWGEELPSSPHLTMVENTCVGCHMAATPGMSDNGTPDDTSDDTPLPGSGTVGEHTFSMVSPVDGTENVAACQTCHGADVTSFAMTAKGDYDGNGTVGTNEEEIAGLLDLVKAELEKQGVTILDSYPYFQLPDGASVDLKGAVFNFKLIRDNDIPAHNLKYEVSLLQLSYEKLTGNPVPNADKPE